jgi:hypothetical protein
MHAWRIFADCAQYCFMPAMPWARTSITASARSLRPSCFRGPSPQAKGAVKLHTLLDLQDKVHDVNILDQILPEAGAFCFMDRGYVDLERPRCVPAAIARPSEPFPTDVESA